MRDALQIILDDFADAANVHRLRRDAFGVHALVFDRQWVVNLELDTLLGKVALFASPGHVMAQPTADEHAMQWQPLEDPLLRFPTRVGIHLRSGMVMLDSTANPAALDTVSFRRWLLAFVDQLVLWHRRLEAQRHALRV